MVLFYLCLLLCGGYFQVTLVTFAVYVLSDPNNVLDAEKAFVSLALFNLLRFPMSMFPMLVVAFVQVKCSLRNRAMLWYIQNCISIYAY